MKNFEKSTGGYVSPRVEQLDVDVELGFALSLVTTGNVDDFTNGTGW